MIQAISREEEAALPDFDSHEEARNWFKEKYGKDFMMVDSELISEEIIYFYHLILNRDVYEREMEKLRKGEPSVGTDLMNSYQVVEIFEGGNIHIVH